MANLHKTCTQIGPFRRVQCPYVEVPRHAIHARSPLSAVTDVPFVTGATAVHVHRCSVARRELSRARLSLLSMRVPLLGLSRRRGVSIGASPQRGSPAPTASAVAPRPVENEDHQRNGDAQDNEVGHGRRPHRPEATVRRCALWIRFLRITLIGSPHDSSTVLVGASDVEGRGDLERHRCALTSTTRARHYYLFRESTSKEPCDQACSSGD